jgi:CelD/BcsL family acetyltransferase involved in cellulose biosynthesis
VNAPFAPAIDVSLARSPDAFAALESVWDALFDESGRTNPFLSYAWTRACFDEECGGAEPFILTVRSGEKLVGLAPLCIETRFGFRVLRFISEHRSDYLGFLCRHRSGRSEWRALASNTLDNGGLLPLGRRLGVTPRRRPRVAEADAQSASPLPQG